MTTGEHDLRLAVPRHVRIGGVGKAELLARLTEADVALNPLAEQLFADPRFSVAAQAASIEVAAVTVADLGCARGATSPEFLARAAAQGLAPCPLELAPHLRLQFTEPPEAGAPPPTRHRAPPGSLTVVSTPPGDSPEDPSGFYLRRIADVRWLRGYRADAEHVWAPGDLLLFARPTP